MAITNGYATLSVVKANIDGLTSSTYDSAIELAVEAVSRSIDKHLGRRFYAASETRYFSPWDHHYLETDDLLSVTSLKTDKDGDQSYADTWGAGDYNLMPLNAALDGGPYTAIQTRSDGDYRFPIAQAGVQIIGSFGYAATAPEPIQSATILQTERLFRRKDAPFGIAGSPEIGAATVNVTLDPETEFLLRGYVRQLVGVV